MTKIVVALSLMWAAAQTNPEIRIAAGTRTSVDEAREFLGAAEIPGGHIQVGGGCDSRPAAEFTEYRGSADAILKQFAVRPDLKSFRAGSAVVFGSSDISRTPLATRIRVFTYQRGELPSASTSNLVALPEFRRSMKRLKLREALQYGAMMPMGSGNKVEPAAITLRKNTALQILNSISSMNEGWIWTYDEFVCKGATRYRISWTYARKARP